MNLQVAGKCLCGAIKFVAIPKDGLLHCHACHCSMCRNWSGSMTMTMRLEEPPHFISGEDLVVKYQSSEWAERCFCKTCGSNLFQNAPNFGYYGVSTGVLDDDMQSKLTMDKEVFIDKKPLYYSFKGEQETMTEAEFLALFSSHPTTEDVGEGQHSANHG